MWFPSRRFFARLQAPAALASFLLLIAGRALAYPPPLDVDDDSVHEAEVHVVSSPKAVSYTVLLPHAPFTVTAEDFGARVIANKVIKISIDGTPVDWHFRLVEAVPEGIKLIPPIEVERLPGDHTGAVWRATVVIPKSIRALQTGLTPPPKQGAAPAGGEAAGVVAVPGAYPTPGPVGRPPAAYPWVRRPLQTGGATQVTPEYREQPLPSASVIESMPLPSFDN